VPAGMVIVVGCDPGFVDSWGPVLSGGSAVGIPCCATQVEAAKSKVMERI
jgi:hypothetical protein